MYEEIENRTYSESMKTVKSGIFNLPLKDPHIQIALLVNSTKHLRKR